MKKILLVAFAMASLSLHAQQNKPLLDRAFWEGKPNVATVKAELDKGFDFKEIKGATDPLFMAINNDAPDETIKYLIDQPGVDLAGLTVEGRIYLHIAANKGNAEITDYLLKKGSDMYFLDANGHTALTFAAGQGTLNVAVIDAFLKNGLDINRKYQAKDGANILLLAVSTDKDLTITDYLISKGLSINSTDDQGNTAFNYAARIGHVGLMKSLLQKGAKYNENALLMASQGTYRSANKIDVYQYLVEDLKMNPKIMNKAGQNVLHFITKKQNQADVVKYFASKGVDVNKADQDGNTPFINAASGKSFEVVETLFPLVKNINAVNKKGESALVGAVKSGLGATVSLLLSKGADVNVKDADGNDLAYLLIQSYSAGGGRGGRGGFGGGRPGGGSGFGTGTSDANASPQDDFGNKMKALQAKGVNLTAPQKDGSTLYHLAAAKNDVVLFKKLADLKIDINAKNKQGETALFKAALVAKDDSVLRYLLSIGAKKEMANEFGETAYSMAKDNESLSRNNVSVDFLK
ncbi:ankyrin repeat domain-containing protein [Pedobacter chinensis]|uniref:Ankyrin repeat domain-containing protein n=1 Tax=Pedobacter chinensis TaxID=2282421 RepID=A0A369PWT3_9SPHI|nr:ankyrin repeat domain-containing protein [Pedobacter chinensis]RDC55176.1 ankyrin repeat domain-containing protein [Pedobacter chinensis]